MVSDRRAVANRALGEVRLALADLLSLRPALPPADPAAWRLLWVTEGTVEKHVRSILAKLPISATEDDHRRVLAVLAFLEAR